jgi:hypothetical protein
MKCRGSQELIYTQIPWASAGAERSRNDRERSAEGNRHTEQQTPEEELLYALLEANKALQGVLSMYDDVMRVAEERMTADIIRVSNDVEMNRRVSVFSSLCQGHFAFLVFSDISPLCLCVIFPVPPD